MHQIIWNFPKGLVRGLEELEIRLRAETIQTIALLDWPEYWEESCSHLDSCEMPSASAGVKNSQVLI